MWEENNKFSQSSQAHAARGFKPEQCKRQFMQPRFHAALYMALQNSFFFTPLGFSGTWYIVQDMFLDQKPLKNLLLQLVAGCPTFGDKMPGLFT